MDKLMRWFRTTPFYYWIVLVIWQSIIEIPNWTPVRDKVMDVALYIIIFILLTLRFINTKLASSLNFNWIDIVITLAIVVGTSFLRNLILIPARSFFTYRKKQDRNVWEDVAIYKDEIKTGSIFRKVLRAYGIAIENNKAYPLENTFILLRYLEIDGVRITTDDDYRLAQSSSENCPRLPWNGANPVDPLRMYIEPNGGRAIARLLHVNGDGQNYKIQYYRFSERDGRLMPKSIDVKHSMKGEFSCLVKYGMPGGVAGSGIYSFEVAISENNMNIILKQGEISYKLQEAVNEIQPS